MSGTSDNLALAIFTVFVGSIVQGIIGFGCSLVWMSVFPLFTSVPDAVGVLQPLAPAMNILVFSRSFRHATPWELKPLAITVPIGIGVGLWIVTFWPAKAVNGLLGGFLIAYTFLRNDHTSDGRGEGGETDKQKGGGIELQAMTKDEDSDSDSETEPMLEPDIIECKEEELFVT
uniref:Uncharacterized protein n=1 Tax=Odontella aurita TaxID=265563 RepID=A0A7S4HK20_9STRA|mmetsp:Transcript_11059/g.32800  ORF Transcript_11059/g.32800 Transcript_11059/m.32800 type:complete len:174 (+) Transcript_11059:122-643(+)|eukprot:CAMPEP_0113527102 /NCGR_PEP_ID=MMETSP0015_2-20120614/1113_1 /TAXON_ID=2838 /ORGANISM="Odontella" /LENGTH=173 /DNA_ID=CAMNT_0000425507 /DNA_START=123 /DNA_END=644 /DNA_ORIENTATION=+ /assembly_acc=CAM_ASM_000160